MKRAAPRATTLRIARDYGIERLKVSLDRGFYSAANMRELLGLKTIRPELEKRMNDARLHQSMTDANVLDELGKCKAPIARKGTRLLLEVSKKPRELLAALKVPELA